MTLPISLSEWRNSDNTTSFQGSVVLMEGSDLHFVTQQHSSAEKRKKRRIFSLKLLKVEYDYAITQHYRFFVPKIRDNTTLCQCLCLQKDNNHGTRNSLT